MLHTPKPSILNLTQPSQSDMTETRRKVKKMTSQLTSIIVTEQLSDERKKAVVKLQQMQFFSNSVRMGRSWIKRLFMINQSI
jgi:hypothetical protein